MTIHCTDCWQKKENQELKGIRSDICNECWDARAALIKAKGDGNITDEQWNYAIHGESRAIRIAKVLGGIKSGSRTNSRVASFRGEAKRTG